MAQDSISFSTVSRVPLRQPRRSPWRCSAPCARRRLFDTDWSAVGRVSRLVRNREMESDLRPRSRFALAVFPGRRPCDSLSIYSSDRKLPVAGTSIQALKFQRSKGRVGFSRFTLTQYSRRTSRMSSANLETAAISTSSSTYPSVVMRSLSPFALSLMGLRSLSGGGLASLSIPSIVAAYSKSFAHC